MKDTFLLRSLIWISENTASFSLIFLLLVSVSPFFYHSHGEKLYSALGAYCSFCSMLFVWLDRKKIKDAEAKLFFILGTSTVIIGLLSLALESEKNPIEYNLFYSTYQGALLGLWVGAFLFFGRHNYNSSGK